MSFIDKTPEGRYRAYFRDPAGKQRSKTFRTKKDATAFLAEIETAKTRGAYVSPHAGRVLFADHAAQWMATWNTEITTVARDRAIMRTHVLPRWGDAQLAKIDHIGLQAWVTELGKRRSRATVVEALRFSGRRFSGRRCETGSSRSTRPRTYARPEPALGTPTSE